MRGETRRKARRCIRRRSIAARIAVKTTGAAVQGAGERSSPRAPRRTPEGAMRGLLRRRQRSGTRENETSRAGLRPEDIYVYGERSQGRANRPFLAGRAPLRQSKPHAGRQTSPEHHQVVTSNAKPLQGKHARGEKFGIIEGNFTERNDGRENQGKA